MEEDIKILEQFLRGNKYCKDCKSKCVDCYIEYEEVQAVANLIKAYKELEKENIILKGNKVGYKSAIKELKEENESLVRQYEYQGALMVNEYFSKKQVFELFIPKSKVKEKIEELKGLEFGTDLVTQSTANLTTICILNKLLEK